MAASSFDSFWLTQFQLYFPTAHAHGNNDDYDDDDDGPQTKCTVQHMCATATEPRMHTHASTCKYAHAMCVHVLDSAFPCGVSRL